MEIDSLKNDLEIFNYIRWLNKKGVYLFVEDNKLKYRIQKGIYDINIINDIKNNKVTLLSFLKYIKNNQLELSSLQLSYMSGRTKEKNLNKVSSHYYIEYENEKINIEKLEKAVNILINKVDSLRLIMLSKGKALILNDLPKYTISTYDYKNENIRKKYRNELAHKVYQLETWPMFNFTIGKNILGSDVLHISFDCSILDAWSAGKLIEKLFNLYLDKKVDFSKTNYKKYLESLHKYKSRDSNRIILQKIDQYWDKNINKIYYPPKLKLNKDVSDLNNSNFERQSHKFSINFTNKLVEFSKYNKITLSAFLITAYMKALSYLSSNKKFTINMTMFGKLPILYDVDDLIGEFTNIALISYEDNKSTVESIKQTQEQLFNALQNRMYDGVDLINKFSRIKNYAEGFPIVVTSMLNENYKTCQNGFEEVYSISQTPQVLIDHHLRMIDNSLVLSFDYVGELFSYNYINNLIDIYITVIKEIINEGDFI